MEVLMDEMQRALQLFEEWSTGAGSLTDNPNKTQCILFTRNRSLDTSRGPIFYDKMLDFTKEVKYLGVVQNDNLNCRAHMEQMKAKFLNVYWLCRRMVGVTWGLRPKLVKWIYDAVIIPRLTYGSVVCWHRSNLVTEAKNLDRLQAMMLRSTVGAPRNTPQTALRVLVGVPPIRIVIKESAARIAARLRALGEWIPTQGTYAEIAELPCMELLNNDLDRTVEEIIFEKRFSVRMSSRDE